ncbi:MAG: sigma-54 dependent transcriptional regulator [Desulfovibrio sp.]|jgi:DNA-binding NtrC family response regulator|nr:sigma-54 dependent transcriptional regulator [Desulfovibrio sp.]
MRILVIDDNNNSLQSLCLVLKDLGHDPHGMEDPVLALAAARNEYFPLIITDIRMPGLNGLELLTQLKNDSFTHSGDVVLITGHGDMATAVEALRKGAYDYLNKPINARELAVVVDRVAEHQSLMLENKELRTNIEQHVSRAAATIKKDLEKTRYRLREIEGIGQIIAESPSMLQLLREALILHGAPTVSVLIEGETGTGKEVLARYVHHGESVVEAPFMAINCAAIPHELFESELFGHEQGAFTGSRADGAPGKLEQAGKGTLFLDEVAEMPLSLQPKLLRVLEERSFYRVGGMKKRVFAARIVCAGNRNMMEMVEKGTFRRDLYHRLRVGHLLIPPLRERFVDIRPLAEHFFFREAKRKKKQFTGIAPATMDILQTYAWPGNVRELENTMERSVLMHDGPLLLPEHIHFLFQGVLPASAPRLENSSLASDAMLPGWQHTTLPISPIADAPAPSDAVLELCDFKAILLPDHPICLDDLMNAVIKTAIKRFDGNKTKAAKYLGISRFALHRRLQQMGEK